MEFFTNFMRPLARRLAHWLRPPAPRIHVRLPIAPLAFPFLFLAISPSYAYRLVRHGAGQRELVGCRYLIRPFRIRSIQEHVRPLRRTQYTPGFLGSFCLHFFLAISPSYPLPQGRGHCTLWDLIIRALPFIHRRMQRQTPSLPRTQYTPAFLGSFFLQASAISSSYDLRQVFGQAMLPFLSQRTLPLAKRRTQRRLAFLATPMVTQYTPAFFGTVRLP